MTFISKTSLLKCAMLVSMGLTIAACENTPSQQEYSISITNITHGQPLSPPAALLHKSNFQFWNTGEAASDALELMAEGGDASGLLALRTNNPQHLASAPLLPGETIEFTLMADNNSQKHLSVAGMLVNTNDAFTGLTGIELKGLDSGQSSVYYSQTYDAGTEFNSEAAGTIPGPVDGGEGFNAERDDVTGVVTYHGGVVTADDNYTESVLSESEKFDNPSLRIVITAL